MSFPAVKFTYISLLLLVALLGLGGAQDVPGKSELEGVSVQTHRQESPILASETTPLPTVVSEYIRRRRQSTSACLAPAQPINGEWQLDRFNCQDIADCTIPEGTALEPGSQLLFKCKRGYKVEGDPKVYCRATGKWSRIPTCGEVRCQSLSTVSTGVSCTRFSEWVDCNGLVAPQTQAEVFCRHGYKKDTSFINTQSGSVNCNWDGLWEPEPIKCIPVCGLAITHQTPFVTGGRPAQIGDFPWHASLFVEKRSRNETKKAFICGATIIQTNLVLTAAHCVFDETNKQNTNPDKLFVITGNVFRDYDSPFHNPKIVRKALVKNVYVYCSYYGLVGNYGSDIALLELKEAFKFSSILLPACLDESGYSDQLLEPGAWGRVAGFGRTELGEGSAYLQTISVPYIAFSECKAPGNNAQNEAFITNDKFCAGYKNGSAVCEGDSGGGLVFKKGDLWYVMGIVSVGLNVDLNNGEKTCDKYSYSLYTKVPTYVPWIKDVLFYLERNLPHPSCNSTSNS